MFDNIYSTYEVGLYRKYNIKNKRDTIPGKHKFSYSQAGIRISYLNPKSGINNLNTTTDTLFIQPNILQIEGGVILGRFMMFNLGVVNLSKNLSELKPFSKNYTSATLGFRIPFGPIHITTEANSFTDFNKIYQMQFRFGLSLNFGLIKKFNSNDRKYLKKEVDTFKQTLR